MNLAVDIGNSAAKIGVFRKDELIYKYEGIKPENLQEIVTKFAITGAILSTVTDTPEVFLDQISALDRVILLTHQTPLPLRINYDTPETLGRDRIAASCGAQALFPNENCLVIDCGSCITYDVLSVDGTYQGGAITPGLTMRFQSLNTFTSNLPLIQPEDELTTIGKSTKECIQSGVVNGILSEMEGYIHRLSDIFQPLKLVMCGGDTYFFENKVKARIFAAPELVLRGLNRILQHNAS
ncbi:MAG: type III pantothenate kinase [Bacteroidota bacterium]